MEHKEYNGWWNYETWCVNLWLTNERDSYDIISDLAMDYTNASEIGEYEFSKRLRDYVEEMNPLADDASLFSDLLGAALSECNWQEIAEHWLDDYREDHPEESPIDPEKPEFYLTPSHYAGKLRWMITDEEMDSEFEECDSFWDAFNWCVQWAIDNNSDSLTVNFEVFESDVKQAESLKAKSLIERQHSRNTPAIKCAACKGTGGDVPYTGADCPICSGSGWESNLTLD